MGEVQVRTKTEMCSWNARFNGVWGYCNCILLSVMYSRQSQGRGAQTQELRKARAVLEQLFVDGVVSQFSEGKLIYKLAPMQT
jgi:hypothetical protein